MKRQPIARRPENGIALIFALVLVLVLSVIAAALLFVSRSETWASMNYRTMTQARYGAESGINSAANYLINVYTPPTNTGADQYANYTQVTPGVPIPGSALSATVQYNGNLVALAAPFGNSAIPFNYSYVSGAGVRKGFADTATGTIQTGNDTVNYTTYATLISMEQLTVYGSTKPATVQTWLITADGNISNILGSQVELSAVLEQKPVPTFEYAAFATSQGCGALNFSGGGSTASYDSSIPLGGNGLPVIANNNGNVGSNGNLNEGGTSTTINGTMSTPATGVGKCSSGSVTPWSTSGNPTVTGGIVQLPQTVSYPTPTVPPPGTTNLSVTKSNSPYTLAPESCVKDSLGNCSYGDISVGSNGTLQLAPGTYDINSLSMTSSNAAITIVPDPVTGQYGPVVLNISGSLAGDANNSNPLSLTGNGIANQTYVPSNLQIVYAGTATLNIQSAQTAASALVYAPNATIDLNGNANFYGALIGKTVNDTGGASINYDRRLQKELYTLGNWQLDSFTWKKY